MDKKRRERERQILLEGRGANKGAVLRNRLRSGNINADKLAVCAFVRYEPAEEALKEHVKGYYFRWFDKLIDRGDSRKTIEGLLNWPAHVVYLATLGLVAPEIQDLTLLGKFSAYAIDPSRENRREAINHPSGPYSNQIHQGRTWRSRYFCDQLKRVIRDTPAKKSKWMVSLIKTRIINMTDDLVYKRLQKTIVPWALGEM